MLSIYYQTLNRDERFLESGYVRNELREQCLMRFLIY